MHALHHRDLRPALIVTALAAALAIVVTLVFATSLTDPTLRADYDDATAHPMPVSRPPHAVRRGAWSAGAGEQTVQLGILELSAPEAASLARRPLVLADEHGHTIVVPAGARDGDQLVLGRAGRRVVLRVRVTGKT